MESRLFVFCVIFAISCFTCAATGTPAAAGSTEKADECVQKNSSCEECVKDPKCLWCPSRPTACSPYPSGKILPPSDYCKLDEARWGLCWVNYKILLICMGIVAGALFLSISCCCVYCCCCRSKEGARKRLQAEESKIERETNERKARHSERRKERESKYEEIRKKYGLQKDDKYQKFENEI